MRKVMRETRTGKGDEGQKNPKSVFVIQFEIMKYITGIYALNLPCSLDTTGDWHSAALDWNKVELHNSKESIFGDWGIEKQNFSRLGEVYVANHIRAILDLFEQGYYNSATGMNKQIIDNDVYNITLFTQTKKLRSQSHWSEIDRFMTQEYGNEWRKFTA